jgi:hypothetical protein
LRFEGLVGSVEATRRSQNGEINKEIVVAEVRCARRLNPSHFHERDPISLWPSAQVIDGWGGGKFRE